MLFRLAMEITLNKNIEDLVRLRGRIDERLERLKRTLTLMFTDMRGYTEYVSRRGDTAGLAKLQRQSDLLFPFIAQHRGVVSKTIGDAIMAFFERPAEAVAAAVAMQQALADYNRNHPESEQIQIRIGLNEGIGIVREDNDVYGDVVNVAARIQSLAQPEQILASHPIFEKLPPGSGFTLRHLETVPLAGKSTPERIYEVVWRAGPAGITVAPETLVGKGKTLKHYQLLEKVGEGGMGMVYKAQDTRLDRLVALKLLPASSWADEAARKRFLREAKSAAAVEHPNICTIYEVGEAAGIPFIAMQFLEGQTLRERLAAGPLPREQFFEVSTQVALALEAAHRKQLVHRDVKAANVMLTEQGQVKVLDFGIAQLLRATTDQTATTTATETGRTSGTLTYMSPEQLSGLPLDTRTDLFSLGVLLYELVAGKLPFEGATGAVTAAAILQTEPEPLTKAAPNVPAELERIVHKALAKNREARYQTARDLLIDLTNLRQQLYPGARSIALPPASPWWRRRQAQAAAGAVALLLLVVLGVGLWARRGSPRPASHPGHPAQAGAVALPPPGLPAPPSGPFAQKPTLAVLAFSSPQQDRAYAALPLGIADAVAASALQGGGYRLLERMQLEQAIKELRLNQSDLIDPLTAQKIGRMIGAQYLVLGSFQVWAGQIRIHGRLLRVETGEILAAEQVTGPLKQALELPDELAGRLLGRGSHPVSPGRPPGGL